MNALEQIESPRAAPGLRLPADLRTRILPLAVRLALVALVVMAVVMAVDSAAAPSDVVAGSRRAFPGWLAGPLHLLPGARLTPGTYSELTYGMIVAWLVVAAGWRYVTARTAVIVLVGLHVLFVLTPPLASTDVWNYIGYSHLGALHNLSPYAHVPAAAPHDPAYRWVTWPTYRTPYGPLFTALTYLTAPLGVAAGLWTLKVVLGVTALACLWLVARCARQLGREPLAAVLFVGLSPAWLIWTVGGAHNDVLMLVLMLAGLTLWLARRELTAGALIVLAAAFKITAILLLPFLALRALDRRRMLAGAAAALAGVAAVSLVAFGSLTPLTAFQSQSDFHSNRSVFGQVFRLFDAPQATPNGQVPAMIVLAIAIGVLLVLTARGRLAPLRATGWTLAAVLVVMQWEFPWYVTWVLPFAALARDRRLKLFAVALAVILLLDYVPLSFALTS